MYLYHTRLQKKVQVNVFDTDNKLMPGAWEIGETIQKIEQSSPFEGKL